MNYIKTKNVLLGLSIGDSLSWQAMYNRSTQYPYWTRRLRREIDAESENNNILKINLPFSLNNPVELFNLSPTDDTEWAAFTSEIIIKDRGEYNFNSHLIEWKKLADIKNEIKGSVSIIAALKNLKQGLTPPCSGNDNPHYFDDSAMVRAAVIGSLYPGDLMMASEFVELDASITNSLDGVWAAKAFAAAVSAACVGNDIDTIINSAIEQIPEQSWLSIKVNEALSFTKKRETILEALPLLHDNIIDHSYNYGSSAPDNFALTLALFKLCKGDLFSGITSALSLSKTADSVPAFVGALCGAVYANELPSTWHNSLKSLRGICIPFLKDKKFTSIAEELNGYAANKIIDRKDNF